jgi:pilus assembly protein FimV
VALLAGLGLYRVRGRLRKSGNGETSFLESRLQPDSFFGASGGQRIDTRESVNSQGASSMSYSLSQLDAIGDVDPVAEADVYLAYGRDLQAEEILKEALRGNPERMAIRTKLLEVYAKRRDAKGFELLANQMHGLTRGEGEDWAKAQELGRSIDPDNPLYLPGGKPEAMLGSAGQPVEPLGASTVPHTIPKTLPPFQPAGDATLGDDADVDLEIDLGPTAAPAPAQTRARGPETTQPIAADAALDAMSELDFDLDAPTLAAAPAPAPRPAPGAEPRGLDFDLGDLVTDLPPPAPAAAPSASGFGAFSIGGESIPSMLPGDGDPLERKLELAEEFRQIGDLEGARDLLEEVVAKSDGPLRNKAQAMLDSLA